jgi:hypothetical protein
MFLLNIALIIFSSLSYASSNGPSEYERIIDMDASGFLFHESFCANPKHYSCKSNQNAKQCVVSQSVVVESKYCSQNSFKANAYVADKHKKRIEFCERQKQGEFAMKSSDFDCSFRDYPEKLKIKISQVKKYINSKLEGLQADVEQKAASLAKFYWRCPRDIDYRGKCIPNLVYGEVGQSYRVATGYGLKNNKKDMGRSNREISFEAMRTFEKNPTCQMLTEKSPWGGIHRSRGMQNSQMRDQAMRRNPEYSYCYGAYNKLFDRFFNKYINITKNSFGLEKAIHKNYDRSRGYRGIISKEIFANGTEQAIFSLFKEKYPRLIFPGSFVERLGDGIYWGVFGLLNRADYAVFSELICTEEFKFPGVVVCNSYIVSHFYGGIFKRGTPEGYRQGKFNLCGVEAHNTMNQYETEKAKVNPFGGFSREDYLMCDRASIDVFSILEKQVIKSNNFISDLRRKKLELSGQRLNFSAILNKYKEELNELTWRSDKFNLKVYLDYINFNASINDQIGIASGSSAPAQTAELSDETSAPEDPVVGLWRREEKSVETKTNKEDQSQINLLRGQVRNQIKSATDNCFSNSSGVSLESSFDPRSFHAMMKKCESKLSRGGCSNNERAFGEVDCNQNEQLVNRSKLIRSLQRVKLDKR